MISKAGLGVWAPADRLPVTRPTTFKSALERAEWDQSERYARLVSERLQAFAEKYSKDCLTFVLMSAPGAGCICDATWNNGFPPAPNPEEAPIVSLLREMLGLPFVRFAAFFYGPVDLSEPDQVSGWKPTNETPEQFIERFFTETPDKIISNSGGFYLISTGRS